LGVERVLAILARLLVAERVLTILALLVGNFGEDFAGDFGNFVGDLAGVVGVFGDVGVLTGNLVREAISVVDSFTGDFAGDLGVVGVFGVGVAIFGLLGLATDFALATLSFLDGVLGFGDAGALAILDLFRGVGAFFLMTLILPVAFGLALEAFLGGMITEVSENMVRVKSFWGRWV
jgi:hypothetical protein